MFVSHCLVSGAESVQGTRETRLYIYARMQRM